MLGVVDKSDLLGPPAVKTASNARCPNTHSGSFVGQPPLGQPMHCPNDIPLYVRGATLEDPIGVLEANARFELIRDSDHAQVTVAVRIADPAVVPLLHAAFSVRRADLEACVTSP